MAINLIPSDQGSKDNTDIWANRIKILDYFLLAGFVIFISFGGLFIYYLAGVSNDHLTKLTSLKTEVKDLENSEQALILAKDRLMKISPILKSDFAKKDFETIDSLANNSGFVKLVDGKSQEKKLELTFLVQDSSALKSFLDQLSKDPNHKETILKTVNFRPESGFFLTLELSR